jgi:hypothetical protein
MAKKQTFESKASKGKQQEKKDYNFFGTKADMIVKEITEGDIVVKVIAKDNKGLYVTYPEHVDSGLSDPNRYGADRTKPTGFEEEIEKDK